MTKKEAWDICRARQHAAWVRFCDEVVGSHPTEHYNARRLVYQSEYDAAIAEWRAHMDGPRTDKMLRAVAVLSLALGVCVGVGLMLL